MVKMEKIRNTMGDKKMSLFRKVYDRLVRFDEDAYIHLKEDGNQGDRSTNGVSVYSLLPSSQPPKEEPLGIGAMVEADWRRIYNGY